MALVNQHTRSISGRAIFIPRFGAPPRTVMASSRISRLSRECWWSRIYDRTVQEHHAGCGGGTCHSFGRFMASFHLAAHFLWKRLNKTTSGPLDGPRQAENVSIEQTRKCRGKSVEQDLLKPLLDDRAGSCIVAGVRCTCVKTERFHSIIQLSLIEGFLNSVCCGLSI